ncbi:MAG: porin family protein [Candidatus Pseudomonas phytovorans]|uniref:Porin family protein n=1 Tax=Candidatus Pseudomonas phytovorans TaxID=3121377 RepID=A0AAJ6BE22_9PSED|nr:porin family protein [Pseudomonas sp.]WEK31536.1 MAG: porin family protein [Pseudomonas sp.]
MSRSASLRILSLCLLATQCPALLADEDDTRQLLNKIDRNVDERERTHVPRADPAEHDASLITIEGQTYNVQNTLQDLGPAIYVALNLQQWEKARQFVARYRQLAGHEEALVYLAEGMLARQQREHGRAIEALRQAIALEPGHVRAKLELARTLFEDNQSAEAQALFDEVKLAELPEAVLPILQGYQHALDERDSWHGSLSAGFGYNSNINQGNGMLTTTQVCFVLECVDYSRKMPDPIKSSSLVYDLAAERRLQLSGNHHLLVRGLSYGNDYHRHSEEAPQTWYDENTSVLYAGYNYLSALHDASFTPLFETYYSNHHTKYQASGMRGEWKYALTDRWRTGLVGQYKHFRFQGEQRDYFDDFDERTLGGSLSYLLDSRTLVFGGITYTRRTQAEASASNREYMGNLGVYRMFDVGVSLSLTALYRETRYDEEDAFLGGLRRDRQQIYIANLGMPRFAVASVVPNLYVKRTVNDSSIDWAYAYRQTEVALKFEKTF